MTPPLLPKPKRPVVRGPRERWNQLLVRIRQLEGDPHRIALGLAVGVFASVVPILPLQTIVAVALAVGVRGNKTAAVLGSLMNNPLTIPIVYYADYKLGCLLLGYQPTLQGLNVGSWLQLMTLGMEVVWAMLVGGVVIGAVAGVAAYWVAVRIFASLRHKAASDPGLRP